MITQFSIVCLCMTASAMVGLLHTKHKRARLLYFASCEKLTEKLIADISFRKENLCTVLTEFAAEDGSELKRHIEKFCGEPYEKFAVNTRLLKAGERRLVSEFFASLGDSDTQTQIFSLENYKTRFSELYRDESERFKKSGGIGLKLSVLAGIAVGILLL
ncbi:MAG: hypothetical protein HFE47_03765 [Clostridia bacterium]|nr:hypothetical protein [Clostridia bacterium]